MYTSPDLSDTYSALLLAHEEKSSVGSYGSNDLKLILILRRLLKDAYQVDNVFYRFTPEGEYDSSDLCMEETTVFAYHKGDLPYKYDKGFLREMVTIITDGAASISEYSHGSIENVIFDMIGGLHSIDTAWEKCKLLLCNVASASGLRLTFPQTGSETYANTYAVRVWNEEEEIQEEIASVEVDCSGDRFHGNFSIELR